MLTGDLHQIKMENSKLSPCGSNINLNWNKDFHLMFQGLYSLISAFSFLKHAKLHQLFCSLSNDLPKIASPERLVIQKVTRVITFESSWQLPRNRSLDLEISWTVQSHYFYTKSIWGIIYKELNNAVWLLLFRLPEMAEFISRCEEFLVEEFSPLDSQWSNEDFLSLSSNGLQKGKY